MTSVEPQRRRHLRMRALTGCARRRRGALRAPAPAAARRGDAERLGRGRGGLEAPASAAGSTARPDGVGVLARPLVLEFGEVIGGSEDRGSAGGMKTPAISQNLQPLGAMSAREGNAAFGTWKEKEHVLHTVGHGSR